MLRKTRQHLCQGFTLIEILVVVVILGIASAVIIPQLGSRDDINAAAAARTVMADLIYAQNRAIVTQKKHYISFTTAYQYTIYDDPSMTTPITHPIRHDNFVTKFAQNNTPLQMVKIGTVDFSGQGVLEFDELGTPYGYDPIAHTETSMISVGKVPLTSNSYILTIEIQPYTGEMNVPQP